METLTAPVVAEPTTPIRPSEALRLGRLLYPVRLTDGRCLDPQGRAACAIQVIWSGGGPKDDFGPRAQCPVVTRRWFRTYPCHSFRGAIDASSLVIHLNDDHKWSDDQIVAWLENLGL